MEIYTCPLCASQKTELIESIRVADLNILYSKILGIRNALKADNLEYRECKECTLKFFWPMETGTESLYKQLQAFDWYYMADKQEYQIALRFLPSAGSILEVGAGKAAFANLIGTDRYTGLEFNDGAIEQASRDGINLQKESVESHSLGEKKYDSVVSFQVLEHVKSPFSFVKACVHCLKPGGILVLAVPSRDGFAGEIINHVLDMPPHHVSHWSERTLKHLARLFNLEIIAVEHEQISTYHYKLARKTQIETLIRRFLGLDFKLVDLSCAAQLISKVANMLAILFNQQQNCSKGHTVVAIYRKI